MDPVQFVDSWHDFYLGLMSASATLVGLLFVAVSLNEGQLASGSEEHSL